MSRMPYAVAGAVMAAGVAWAIHLVVSPEPWAVDSALAIAIGILVLGIVAISGLLLGRGKWSRYFAAGLLGVQLLLVLVADVEAWMVAALVFTALALGGLAGPWLNGWLRVPISLAIGSFAVVPLVGVAAPDGLGYAHGIAGGLGILTSWGYVRSHLWALWSARIALPAALVVAAMSPPVGGALLLLAAAAAIATLAWIWILTAGLIGSAAGWFVGETVAWLLVGAVTGAGTAAMITLAGVRPVVGVPVGVGAGIGAYLGGTIVGVLCEPAGCPAFEAGAALATGLGALIGIGLVVALVTRSFDEYREGLGRRDPSPPPRGDSD